MKLLAILISLLMMPVKIDKAVMLPILVRAEDYAEKADALYKQMYNFIWQEHEKGKSDIAEEDWNGIVRPLEGQAYSYMEKALGNILEIMEADPGKELWMRLRYDVYDKMNLGSGNLRNMDFYQSGYMEGGDRGGRADKHVSRHDFQPDQCDGQRAASADGNPLRIEGH